MFCSGAKLVPDVLQRSKASPWCSTIYRFRGYFQQKWPQLMMMTQCIAAISNYQSQVQPITTVWKTSCQRWFICVINKSTSGLKLERWQGPHVENFIKEIQVLTSTHFLTHPFINYVRQSENMTKQPAWSLKQHYVEIKTYLKSTESRVTIHSLTEPDWVWIIIRNRRHNQNVTTVQGFATNFLLRLLTSLKLSDVL